MVDRGSMAGTSHAEGLAGWRGDACLVSPRKAPASCIPELRLITLPWRRLGWGADPSSFTFSLFRIFRYGQLVCTLGVGVLSFHFLCILLCFDRTGADDPTLLCRDLLFVRFGEQRGRPRRRHHESNWPNGSPAQPCLAPDEKHREAGCPPRPTPGTGFRLRRCRYLGL